MKQQALPQPEFLSKPIGEMSDSEWESLCDGCGLCCQIRVEDGTTGRMSLTNAACKLLCLNTHQCSDYANRKAKVADCVKITPENVHSLTWLPYSCAYRLVAKGHPLPDWHYLVCGDEQKVHSDDGVSMLGETVSEEDVDWSEYEF
jgi:uncharacterized protein